MEKEENLLETTSGRPDLRIYQVLQEDVKGKRKIDLPEDRFTRIRVERIEYQEKPATAVYFEEVTEHVKVMRLERKIIQKNSEA